MPEEKKEYQDLFCELQQYERKGIYIAMDGFRSSPTQVVKAHMVRESPSYMRDYILNEEGDLKELYFYHVKL